jgi:hypothetical protein
MTVIGIILVLLGTFYFVFLALSMPFVCVQMSLSVTLS